MITPKNRRKCQKCRYEKCLHIGMDSRWVLTADQKKVRFRNYLRKKDEPNSNIDPSSNGIVQVNKEGLTRSILAQKFEFLMSTD